MHIFPPHKLTIFWSAKKHAKTLFSTLHPLSTLIFATATVLAFVLLRNSRFNFHCYTHVKQRLLTNWPGSDATSCAKDYKEHSLVQTNFTEPPNIQVVDKFLYFKM